MLIRQFRFQWGLALHRLDYCWVFTRCNRLYLLYHHFFALIKVDFYSDVLIGVDEAGPKDLHWFIHFWRIWVELKDEFFIIIVWEETGIVFCFGLHDGIDVKFIFSLLSALKLLIQLHWEFSDVFVLKNHCFIIMTIIFIHLFLLILFYFIRFVRCLIKRVRLFLTEN